MKYHIKTQQEEIEHLIALSDSVNGTYDDKIFKYITTEILLITILLITLSYIPLKTFFVFITIAIIAISIAIVEYKKQKYESKRWW